MRLGECAQPHDGRGHRNASGVDQFAQCLAGIRTDNAAADVKHRPLALFDQSDDFVQLKVTRFFALGIKTLDVNFVREENLGAGLLDVFRHIDDHRAWPAAGGDLERLLHHGWDLADVGDEETVFHHRQGHPIKISLLKSSLADHRLWNLSGDRHKRDGVHVRVGDAGDEVRGAGATGGHADACLAGGTGVALSGKDAALFVPGQDGANLLGAGQRLVEFHAGTSRVGEDRVHAFALKCPDEDLAAQQAGAQFALGFRLRIRFCFSCFAHFLCGGLQKKTHDRVGRGLFGNSVLFATSPRPVGYYHDQLYKYCCYDVNCHKRADS